MRHAKTLDRFVAVYGTVACLLLGAAAALNLVVDPSALFPMIHADFLEGFRRNGTRTGKTERLAREVPDVLLLGNSVANQCWDPESPLWEGRSVFCAGLAGGNLLETETMFRFVLERGRPEEVFLVANLRTVTAHEDYWGDWAESRLNPEVDPVDYLLRRLFGWGSIDDCLRVIGEYRDTDPLGAHTSPAGFRDRPLGFEHTWKSFASVAKSYMHEEFNHFRYAPDRVDVVRRILARCRREGIRCTVVVPPQHAILMEAICHMGLEDDYDRFRRDLAAAVVEARGEPWPAGTEAVLWDFSGWSGPRGEPIPLEGRAPLLWFSDPVHFNAALGEAILEEMMHPGPEAREARRARRRGTGLPAALGLRIVPPEVAPLPGFEEDPVGAALLRAAADRRLGRRQWLRERPVEAERIRRIYEETAPERDRRRRLRACTERGTPPPR
jgi:hypothetical protein